MPNNALLAAAAAGAPPCTTPLNPAFETICYKTVATDGRFSIRDYAARLNVSLVTATSPEAPSWAEGSLLATEALLLYFEGSNGAAKPVARTVPLIYRPRTLPTGESVINAAMALPTSVYPDPGAAPQPSPENKPEAFPAQRFAAASFSTPLPATDLQYAYACGEVAQWLASKGLAPVTKGVWAQAWVTYSGSDATEHVQECWLGVSTA